MSKYKFRKSTNEEVENHLTTAEEWVYEAECPEKYALFFGKLRTVFGADDSITDNVDYMYYYSVTAEDGTGNRLYLALTQCIQGVLISMPLFVGDLKYEYIQAKKELIGLIESAEPSDYEWEGFCEDIQVKVKYAVKNGIVFTDYERQADYE